MRRQGQVTVELMIIIAVLLIILLISINIFGTQTQAAQNKQTLLELRQNQEMILKLIYQTSNSPIGSFVQMFIPVSQRDQNFQIQGKNLYGTSAEYSIIDPLPISGIVSPSFAGGQYIQATRTISGITITSTPKAATTIVDGSGGGGPIDGGSSGDVDVGG